ncbi:lipopolysaccharide biosynthesis protein [Paenibacillus selenitireducens]|nr:oligosaccharide flippase family protein [Paenibacillus selenitireducens]
MDNKKMLTNGIIYFCSSIMTQLVNLILIPLYTRNLSQEQFGQFDLIMGIQQLLALGITLGVYSGMIRFFNEFDDRHELKNTSLSFSMLWGGGCIALVWLLNPILFPYLFDSAPNSYLYLPYVVMSSVLMCLNLTYSSFYSMQFKAMKSSAVQVSSIVSTTLFVVIFFLKLDMGIIGILQAQLFGNLTVFVVLFLTDITNFRFTLKMNKLKKMLSFGTGLILGDISAWVLALSDRYLINGFMNLSSVAIYSIGYKIGMLINPVFINPFVSVFTPFKFKVYKEADGVARINKMFKLYNFAGWFGVLSLSIFANIAVSLVATDEYRDAMYLVPIISLSYFLSGAVAFYSLGLHIANKMKLNSSITLCSAIINVICNLILIPSLGIYGSAISTVIAYAITNYGFYHFGSKYYPLGLGLLNPYKYLTVILPLYGIYLVCMQWIHSIMIEVLLNAVLCVGFVFLSLLFNFITREELQSVWNQVLKRRTTKLVAKGVNSES